MNIGGKIGISAVTLALVLSTAQAANAAPQGTSGTTRPTIDTVTLITGDQVTMHDNAVRSVRPGPGREKISFSRFTAGGHTYVIPNDARKLVATGQLDSRLFDLTTLVEFDYDDAHRATMPLIVTHPAGRAAPRAATVSRELPSINGVAMAADKAGAGAVWEALTDGVTTRTAADGVSKVWLDGKRWSTLDHSAPQIGAPTAWEAGLTGEGVKVAVLDTGVDQTHPDLADREIAEANFSDAPDNVDNAGHGTHVASIVAGTGAKSGGKYRGIASGASILDGKVLNDFGGGTESGIIAGMEWAGQQGADIANMSLGGLDTTATDPMEEAVEAVTAQYGTLFVIAAGNAGGTAHTVGSPGSAPAALTVGAVDRDDALAPFSSRGPTEEEGVIKPDITAPGVEIVAALHTAGTIAPPVADGYTAISGTSMAAPHVAGAAAIIAQQHPDWTGEQLKAALSASAKPAPNLSAFEQGAGRVDVAHALTQTVVTEPANLHVGTAAWPHDDNADPMSRTLTYRNLGAADVTLDLTVAATGPDDAPADVFSLSANEITVPAGGTAAVTVTGDTDLGTVDGVYSGAVVATSGDSVTRTPVVVDREVESYNLTMNYRDEQGAPTNEGTTVLAGLDNDRFVIMDEPTSTATIRLPKGQYVAEHLVLTEQGTHQNSIVQPGIILDHDITVAVDAASTKPISVTPPAAATLEVGDIGYQVQVGGVTMLRGGAIVADLSTVSTAQIGDPAPGVTTKNWVNTQWSDAEGAFYGLAWFLDEFPTGFTKSVSRRELATVRADFGPGAEGDVGSRVMSPQPVSGSAFTVGFGAEVPLPSARTEYVTTQDVRWRGSVEQFTEEGEWVAALFGPPRVYRAGRTYPERFNHPVFGPALPPMDSPWAFRSGDTMVVDVWLFGDSAGNAGLSQFESASTKLFLGDELIGETPVDGFGIFPGLPAAAGDYRLTTTATRPARFDLTTSVSAEWTFSSSQVDGTEALDLNVVRFLPKLAADGSAPAGKPFLVPLQVQDETGAATRPRHLSVEVSYDEGTSWQRVPVTAKLETKLQHPAGATSVSFRASATDRDGNTVEQTVIRAYKLR
jgi:subtilisin family serine protease